MAKCETSPSIEKATSAQARGDFATAGAICRAILSRKPNDVAALAILAVATLRRGDTANADEHIRRAIALAPGSHTLQAAHGAILRAAGRQAEAVRAYDRAVALGASDATTHFNRGNALGDLGHFEEALECYDVGLRIGGETAGRLANRAVALQALGKFDAALADAERALVLDPAHAPAFNLKGTLLQDLGQPRAAFDAFGAAISTAPDDPAGFYHRANLLRDIGLLEGALADYDAALDRAPHYAPAHINRANLLADSGRHDEAEQCYAALSAIPEQADAAAWNRSLSQLKRGAFVPGWELYESRWRAPGFQSFRLETVAPRWTPGYRQGTVLAWGEQGIGDEIMFASILPDLARMGCAVVAAVDPRIVTLFARSFPGIRVIPRDDAIGERFESHVPMASLGVFFRRSTAEFPGTPFLVSDPSRASDLRSRLRAAGRPIVGISWASARVPAKTIPATVFATVPALDGACLVNLQYGNCGADLERLAATGADIVADTGIDLTNDLDGLAALITACDAVVTISNVTAHLAGALGKRTFLLLPFAADWRWGRGDAHSLWYGSLTILRQDTPGNWDGVFAKLDRALCAENLGGPRGASRPVVRTPCPEMERA